MNVQAKVNTGQFKIDEDTKQITFLDVRYYADENGDYFPSVTTVLNAYPKTAQFFEWLKRNGEDADMIRDEAGERGSVVHRLTEDYDNGTVVNLIDADGKIRYKSGEWKMFERYVDFTKQVQPEVLRTEFNIISPNLGTAGTIDRTVILNSGKKKGRFILDIKTSNAVHDHYWLQLAAYKKLYEEKFPDEPIDGYCVLWLNAKTRGESKTGAIQGKGWQLIFPEKDDAYYWNLFKCTQTLWLEVNGNDRPNNVSYTIEHKK